MIRDTKPLKRKIVEIDTFWNVKTTTCSPTVPMTGVEIDTFWNVK